MASNLNPNGHQNAQNLNDALTKIKPQKAQDHIYQSMSDGVKQTLAEFGLLDRDLSDNEIDQKERKHSMKLIMDSFQMLKNRRQNRILSQSIIQSQTTLRRDIGKYFDKQILILDVSEDPSISHVDQRLNAKALKRKLVKVLHSKIEKLKEKISRKRQLKQHQKKNRLEKNQDQQQQKLQTRKESIELNEEKEVLIRLQPLTMSSKDYVQKQKSTNSHLQFRLKINMKYAAANCKKQKSVRDIINFICQKWQLRRSQVELRLCRSPAEIVQQDSRSLHKFDYKSQTKIVDLLKMESQNTTQKQLQEMNSMNNKLTLYLLYDIKINASQQEEGFDSDNEYDSENPDYSSSRSQQSRSSSDEESKAAGKDEELGDDFADIFTDILSIMVLQKKQKVNSPRYRGGGANPLNELQQDSVLFNKKPEKILKAIGQNPEVPDFIQGLEYYSQLRSSVQGSVVSNQNQGFRSLSQNNKDKKQETLSFSKSLNNQSVSTFEQKLEKFGRKNTQPSQEQQNKNSDQHFQNSPRHQQNDAKQSIIFHKIYSPSSSRQSAFQPVQKISNCHNESQTQSNQNDIRSNQVGAKITSFKQYFESKKQSSAGPSQCPSIQANPNENIGKRNDACIAKQGPQHQIQQILERKLNQRSNSQDSISAVDYNNQTDSMQCKENLTTSNFINLNFGNINKRSRQDPEQKPLSVKQQRSSNSNILFGGDKGRIQGGNIGFQDEENSIMRTYGFGQNSMNNLLWQNNSNIFPTASNMVGGFGMPKQNNNFNAMQGQASSRLSLSPQQYGYMNGQFENSNMMPFGSQMINFKNQNQLTGNYEQNYNPFSVRTPFMNESNLPFSNQINASITPKKLVFKDQEENNNADKLAKAADKIKQQTKEPINKIKDFHIPTQTNNASIEQTKEQNQQINEDSQSKIDVEQAQESQNRVDSCNVLPHPDQIFPKGYQDDAKKTAPKPKRQSPIKKDTSNTDRKQKERKDKDDKNQNKQNQTSNQQQQQYPQIPPFPMMPGYGIPPFQPAFYPFQQTFINNYNLKLCQETRENNNLMFFNQQNFTQNLNTDKKKNKKEQTSQQQNQAFSMQQNQQQETSTNKKKQSKSQGATNYANQQQQQQQHQQYINAQMRNQYFQYYQSVYGPNFNNHNMAPQANPYFYSLINQNENNIKKDKTLESNQKSKK
ncbi:UNKNOWN [Stylonychia lemnae]|uniref:Uncharacterized protein n=1 Tax=Stylonychia lemnae TaxID=5949 RepID=A0A078ARS8_STYLE|nr:UNKNOWN [Stylonychia lemnae]|eukprot:CDW84879.1 UNKNOWN [Stylonychia lemnae]